MSGEWLKYVWEGVVAIFWGSLWFIAALVFLPTGLLKWLLAKIRPKFYQDEINVFIAKINTIVSLLLSNKNLDVTHTDSERRLYDKFENIVEENKAIEKNIYAIDLSIDIVKMLEFASPIVGGHLNIELYEESLNYVYHYAKITVPLEFDKNFQENFFDKIAELQKTYSELVELNKLEKRADANEKISSFWLTSGRNHVFEYLEAEKVKLVERYEFNKKRLVDSVKESFNV